MHRIDDLEPFTGVHCETTTTGNLLRHGGLELSEPMLFGLGEGLAFGVFVFKNAPAPFLAGRPRPEQITQNLADNLGFDVEYRQTRSKDKAWDNVASFIAGGQPVGVKLDCFSLDYFDTATHFAGHHVTVHGYTDDEVLVVDTAQQGGTRTTGRDAFEEGRLWRGPMASNALSWTVRVHNTDIEWAPVLRAAIVANAESYLNPPIRNFGASGIRKAAELVPSWLETLDDAPACLAELGMLMERGGTGGGLFRNMYRDFLIETNHHLGSTAVAEAADLFGQAALLWTAVSEKFAAVSRDGSACLYEAAGLLRELADVEEGAVTRLQTLRGR